MKTRNGIKVLESSLEIEFVKFKHSREPFFIYAKDANGILLDSVELDHLGEDYPEVLYELEQSERQ